MAPSWRIRLSWSNLVALCEGVIDRVDRIGEPLRHSLHGPLRVAATITGRWPGVGHEFIGHQLVDRQSVPVLAVPGNADLSEQVDHPRMVPPGQLADGTGLPELQRSLGVDKRAVPAILTA